MGSFFEAMMLICFGFSWPLSVYKSYTSKTAKGKSLVFTIVIIIGYMMGIIGKLINHNITYVLALYFINLLFVSVDLMLYFRNKHLDQQQYHLDQRYA